MKKKLKNFDIRKEYSNIDWEEIKDEKPVYKDSEIKDKNQFIKKK